MKSTQFNDHDQLDVKELGSGDELRTAEIRVGLEILDDLDLNRWTPL